MTIRALILAFILLLGAAPTAAQNFPALSGRVVDQADLLTPEQEGELTGRLEALEHASTRQLVVATVPDLQGYPIEDYGYQLGRHWGIGQSEANNGIILLVAPNERRVRIEVGYGLEAVMTDALSSVIISEQILPRFRDNDYPGGIIAGADAIIQQLQAPPEAAEQRLRDAAQAESGDSPAWVGGLILLVMFVIFPILVMWFIVASLRSGLRGKKYRGRRRGAGPIVIWGPGWGGGASSGGGWGGGSSWGGGGGFGGFSGGGGSFGGGGASGGW